jgi:hypothetical protein
MRGLGAGRGTSADERVRDDPSCFASGVASENPARVPEEGDFFFFFSRQTSSGAIETTRGRPTELLLDDTLLR